MSLVFEGSRGRFGDLPPTMIDPAGPSPVVKVALVGLGLFALYEMFRPGPNSRRTRLKEARELRAYRKEQRAASSR